MASKKKSPAKKAVTKKPRRDADGNAETVREVYKDANSRHRAIQSRSSIFYPGLNNVTAKVSPENIAKANYRGMLDAKSAPGRQAPPRTGPVAGGQSSLYARLTGGGLNNRGK
jgi:hypothetical protein